MRIIPAKSDCVSRIGAPTYRSGLRAILAGVLAMLAFASAAVAATSSGDAPMRAFFAPVEVPLVTVDVVAVDRHGEPVTDLTLADFTVLEDGEPVQISHFRAPEENVVDGVPDSPEGPAPLADTVRIVVFVDDTNLDPARRRRAVDHLRTLIDAGISDDVEVMVATYDGRLHLRTPFTPPGEHLDAALQELRSGAALAPQNEAAVLLREMQSIARSNQAASPDDPFSGNDGAELLRRIETWAQASRDRAKRGLQTLENLVRSLSGAEGQKVVLVVSDGIEVRPGEHLLSAWESLFAAGRGARRGGRAFLSATRYDLSRELAELTRTANAHRVSLYALSAATGRGGGATATGGAYAMAPGFDSGHALDLEQSLTMLAADTGGRVLADNPGLGEAIRDVAQELAGAYSLGYRPLHDGDNAYHRIEVRVQRDGVRLRHREGYLDRRGDDRMADRTLAAANLGVTDNELGIGLSVRDAEPRDDGSYVVRMLVTVPIDELVLVPDAEHHRGEISLTMVVRDAGGGMSGLIQRRFPVDVPNADLLAAASRDAGFVIGLAVRPGPQRIAVGVRDEVSRVEATTLVDAEIGEADG